MRRIAKLLTMASVALAAATTGCADPVEEELEGPVEEPIVGEPPPPLGLYRLEQAGGRGGSVLLSSATARVITFEVEGRMRVVGALDRSQDGLHEAAAGGRADKEAGVYVFRDGRCTMTLALDFVAQRLHVATAPGATCTTSPFVDFDGAYTLAR